MRRIALWLCLLAPGLYGETRIVAVNVDSMIHPVTAEITQHAIQQASQTGASAVLLRLNTPGGFGEATRQMVEYIVASPLPVIAFVTPSGGRAASAGFFLLQSGDIAVMASGTHTGAASPVMIFGQPIEPVMRKKVESDAAAWIRSLASARGRNAQAAELAVLEAKSFTEQEALSEKLVDLVVLDESELLSKLDGREVTRFDKSKQTLHTAGATVEDYQLTIRERVTATVADPNLAFLLLAIGGLLIYIEFTTPGVIAPGVIGSILFLLGLGALSVLPINWTGVALLVLAVALFALEAKIASHGVLGAGGAVAMTLGALLLVDGPPDVRIRLSTALAVSIPFAIITCFLVALVVRARALPVASMIEETGVAITDLTPEGKVLVRGEYWDAVATGLIQKGVAVRVTARDGLLLHVSPIAGA